MKRSKNPSFVLTLKLNTTPSDEHILADRFFAAFLMKNRLIRYARKKLSAMRQNKEYRSLMAERKLICDKDDAVSKHRKAEIGKDLARIRMYYGLSEYQFHDWISLQQHRYKKHIDSLTAQKLATTVWRAVEACLFRKGKSIHFQRLDSLLTLEGKNNVSGIRFKDGRLHWSGLVIQPQLRKGDHYAKEALTHRVKYCRIKRMAMGTTYHYYLELVLEGIPPRKHSFMDGCVGIDPGTSSEAVFSEHGCILTELASGCKDIQDKASRLSRKLDRSRRGNNPNNYNDDGTIKKGRKRWVKSKTYMHTQMKLKTLRRRNAAFVKQSEEMLANEILEHHGSDIITEKMDYKALQLKAKDDKVSEKTGKHRSRKRFGKSLSKHAPARFLGILERKLSYVGKTINYVNTWEFKASQYDHVAGDHEKVSLSSRSKLIGDDRVQRDLYSAFLLYCAKDDVSVDRNLCTKAFPLFLKHQEVCVKELLSCNDKHNLSSFGLKDFVTI